jgi:hypothetical protein
MAKQHESRRDTTSTPSHDDVSRRAYELFQARGGEPGRELENWLEAERELNGGALPSGDHDQARSLRREG